MLFTCQAGFEALLARELTDVPGVAIVERGPGWVRSEPRAGAPAGAAGGGTMPAHVLPALVFAHLSFVAPVEIRGDSVNALAARVAEFFFANIRHERIEGAWPNLWLGPAEVVGLGRRIGGVEAAFGELLKKKLSRLAKLAVPDLPRGAGVGPVRGLFVYFADFGRAFVTREAFCHGQRRMADDPLAPSRSYLKVEEAYLILGREPQPGETVCDLGAAPGGWSYSAAKRGARVLAIDNGPLKGGALDHPQIEHRAEDAFRFSLPSAQASGGGNATNPGLPSRFDWLFCDLVEEPHHVMRNLIDPWLSRHWCRYFIFNLKFGRVDAIALLQEIRQPHWVLMSSAPETRIRHLYHDREEFTLVGEIR